MKDTKKNGVKMRKRKRERERMSRLLRDKSPFFLSTRYKNTCVSKAYSHVKSKIKLEANIKYCTSVCTEKERERERERLSELSYTSATHATRVTYISGTRGVASLRDR